MMLRFELTDRNNSDFLELCQALDMFLNRAAGGEHRRAQYIPCNSPDALSDVIVVYDGERAIGCAALKAYDGECAEVKRVFLLEAYRGRGISHCLMERLEALARQRGFVYCILESGEPLEAAMHLYRSRGYEVVPNYGPYVHLTDSVCMKKRL